ncbi:hypothetical protein EDD29_7482 [Actinocorallia herbida]|uniref:DUF3558 domain-containing protein n=2 Tax=Actinocorallia herbida TaxID=58109 RepID=A0A3N1D8C0_9ACTN|nr:hypothetical protein EDD29_7482 [Actinocorallia herbida]
MPRPRGWQVAVVFVMIGAGAVFFTAPLVLDGDEAAKTSTITPSEAPSETASETASEVPSEASSEPPSEPPAEEPSPEFLQALPKEVCETVAEETFLKWVPDGTRESYGSAWAGSCGYGGPDGAPYLRLETRLGNTVDGADPVGTTKWSFDQDFQSDSTDKESKTLRLEKAPGLGDDAYRRVFVEPGTSKATVARIELRVQNVIITVAYARPYEGKPEEQVDACLEGAEAVAREALEMYT